MNILYSDNLEIVNSTEYQELSYNVSAFVSDTGFFPHIFKAVLNVMQTERTLSLMWGLEEFLSPRDLLLSKNASH